MTEGEWRKACPEGCTCGKHRKRSQVHPSDCMCGVHGGRNAEKHKGHSTACEEGCTCSRHRGGAFTPEEVKARYRENRQRKSAAYRERIASDPKFAEAERIKQAEYRERKKDDPDFQAKIKQRQKEHGWRYWLSHKYKLTLDGWIELREAQGGRCYLCGDELPERRDICIDHDHDCCPGNGSCGKCVRGLACRWCNQGLGQFRDDPDRMIRAAEALRAANLRVRSARPAGSDAPAS